MSAFTAGNTWTRTVTIGKTSGNAFHYLFDLRENDVYMVKLKRN